MTGECSSDAKFRHRSYNSFGSHFSNNVRIIRLSWIVFHILIDTSTLHLHLSQLRITKSITKKNKQM